MYACIGEWHIKPIQLLVELTGISLNKAVNDPNGWAVHEGGGQRKDVERSADLPSTVGVARQQIIGLLPVHPLEEGVNVADRQRSVALEGHGC